jgi:hypothetical protein
LQLAKKSSHSQSSIRLALRVAESGKLIDRRRKKVAYSIEVLKALRSTASVTGHANCFIRITDSGSMWQYAKAINQKEGFSSSSEIESKEKSRTGNFPISQTGDNNTINVFGSLMEANNYNPSPETIIDSLTQLCTELKKHAADLDQTVVVGELAEIIIAAKNGSDLQEIKSLTKPGSRAAELREWVKAYALPICGPVITAVLEKLLRLPLGG